MTDKIITKIDERIEDVSEAIVLDQELQPQSKDPLPNEQNPYVIFGKHTEKLGTLERAVEDLQGKSDCYIKKDWKAVSVVLGTISIAAVVVLSIINVWVLGRVKTSECKQEAVYLYNTKILTLKEFHKSYSDCITK